MRTPADEPDSVERITYFWDRFRAISGGINDAVFSTFLLLIAIRVFEASPLQKSLVSGALWAGIFLLPVFLWVASYFRLRCNIACTIYTSITGVFFTLSIFAPTTETFIAGVVVSMIVGVQGYTLLTRILAENYPAHSRGKRVGTVVMLSGIVFTVASQWFGYLLDKDLENYIWILASAAGAYFSASYFYSKMPSPRLSKPTSRFPYHTIGLLWRDKNFGRVALCWALIEFGNLMMVPIRMEYVANGQYGINLSNTQITWLIAIVPLAFALVTSRTWGRIFDRLRVESVQALMAGSLVLSIGMFFTTDQFAWMLVAMAMAGVSMGAQKILNQLWITKLVDKDQVADYVSAFSILNGARGLMAPVFAYWLLACITPPMVGLAGVGILLSGTISLLIIRKSALRHQTPKVAGNE